MSRKTITSANAVFMLAIENLITTPVRLEGYSADDAFSEDPITPTEVTMGVDGKLSAGYTPNPIKVKIRLSPDSDSVAIFDQWYAAQEIDKDVYYANAVITLISTGRTYELTKGALTGYKNIPDAKKKLEAQDYEITFESSKGANI